MNNKFEILPKYHPTVIRRLCKELNYRPAGFYAAGERYNQARFSKGRLQIRMGGDKWADIDPCMATFVDENSEEIVASRTKCGY